MFWRPIHMHMATLHCHSSVRNNIAIAATIARQVSKIKILSMTATATATASTTTTMTMTTMTMRRHDDGMPQRRLRPSIGPAVVAATTSTAARTTPVVFDSRFSTTTTPSAAATTTTTTATSPTTTTTTGFKPWPVAVVDSTGDYRKEAWIETHVGGPLYEHQASLPRLPVPTVTETLARFVPTAAPLARSTTELDALHKAVSVFPQQAANLQERLLERAQQFANDSSWLQLWWNTAGYLQVRDSIVVNVSYYFQLADDATLSTIGLPAERQLTRAAAIMYATGTFRQQVGSGMLPAETVGKSKSLIDSTAYRYMFHSCRIPATPQDVVRLYDPARHSHAVVAVQHQFFAVDLCHPRTGELYSPHQFKAALAECQRQTLSQQQISALGWLTSSHRDDWTLARQALLQAGGTAMQDALTELESGAFLICLDHIDTSSSNNNNNNNNSSGAGDDDHYLVSRPSMSKTLLHGTSNNTGGNRWFDKTIQWIVTPTGKAGFLGEHSMLDGMPMVRLADRVCHMHWKACLDHSAAAATAAAAETNDDRDPSHVPAVRPIFNSALMQQIESVAKPLVQKAKHDLAQVINQHELDVLSFHGYGSQFVKQSGFSPDAYIQVAMQLATYRLWGEQAGTYEATQVRSFLHGRTETTRSVSPQSASFCRVMGRYPAHNEDDMYIRQEKLKLLQDAVQAHVAFMNKAAAGYGVDRHFFGLSMLLQDGETVPDLMRDPVYLRAKRWRVSTSTLTHPYFDNWGYGPVVDDGVGLSYSVHPRHCVFSVTTRKVHGGWAGTLCHLLEEALLEMRVLIELENALAHDEAAPKSKL